MGMQVIGGAATFGLGIVAFALTAEFVGSVYLSLAIIFAMGVCQALYMISVTTTLQVMVPEEVRGRVMGIHTIVYGINPLSGMQAGAMAIYVGTPFAVAIGGLLVMGFALGPALLNPSVRNLGRLLQADERATPVVPGATADRIG
jgi:MFS family permease